jgi:hypothetical protein
LEAIPTGFAFTSAHLSAVSATSRLGDQPMIKLGKFIEVGAARPHERVCGTLLTMDDVLVRSALAAMSRNGGRFGLAQSRAFPTPSAA